MCGVQASEGVPNAVAKPFPHTQAREPDHADTCIHPCSMRRTCWASLRSSTLASRSAPTSALTSLRRWDDPDAYLTIGKRHRQWRFARAVKQAHGSCHLENDREPVTAAYASGGSFPLPLLTYKTFAHASAPAPIAYHHCC